MEGITNLVAANANAAVDCDGLSDVLVVDCISQQTTLNFVYV